LFAAEGANVILADINLAAVEKAVGFIASQSPNVTAIAFKVDIGKENDVKELVDKAVDTFGRLDVMVRSRVTDQKQSRR
jgi:NAD(P)-dependent dehydrogenase (short-subunit alcohol dehydrogenase family)